MPKATTKLSAVDNVQSSPENEAFKTIVTTAIVEPPPKHLRNFEKRRATQKSSTKRRILKRVPYVNDDVIEMASSPERNWRHNVEKRAINLPRSLIDEENDHDRVNKEELSATTQKIRQQNRPSRKVNPIDYDIIDEYKQKHDIGKEALNLRKSLAELSENDNYGNNNSQVAVMTKANYNSDITQCNKNYIKTKTRKIANKPKLKRIGKKEVSRSRNIDTDFISNQITSNSLHLTNSSMQSQKSSKFDELMNSVMESVAKNCANVSKTCRESSRNIQFTTNNTQLSCIDTVLRDTENGGYMSQYSDDDAPKIKQKNKSARKIRNKPQSKNLKKTSADFKKLPQQPNKLHKSSSTSLSSLYIEKEAPSQPKLMETLTDTDSNNEVQSATNSKQVNILSDVIIKKSNPIIAEVTEMASLNGSTVTIPPIHPEPNINISKSITSMDNIPDFLHFTDDIQSEITEVTDVPQDCLLDLTVSQSLVNTEFKNRQINSWIATGLPVDVTQDFKRTAEVILHSYAMILRTYLQSFRAGPLHPDLTRIYNTFVKLDYEMQNYFDKN